MEQSVRNKFDSYPLSVATLLNELRDLIFHVAHQDGITDLKETLKWSQPSYISSIGSTLRFDWTPNKPLQYYVYFNCNTSLVETFKEIYGEVFQYEGKRAIVLTVGQQLPSELAHCISMSLRYKKIKHLELLGA